MDMGREVQSYIIRKGIKNNGSHNLEKIQQQTS